MMVEKISEINEKIIVPASQILDESEWAQIGEEINSLVNLPDQNLAATEILKFVDDPNSDVRDAVASSLEVLDISDPGILKSSIDKMIAQATKPGEQIYTAGRASTFLIKHQNQSEAIPNALNIFKQTHNSSDIKQDLIDNIPQLTELFAKE